MKKREVHRKLYAGNDGLSARYEVGPSDPRDDCRCCLRVFDVVGGDALVFLTPAKARQLIDDLEPFAAPKRGRR